MAPDPKKLSAKKGKARLYMCSVCGVRHTSPTGAKCTRQAVPKRRADDSQTQADSPCKRRRVGRPTIHDRVVEAPEGDVSMGRPTIQGEALEAPTAADASMMSSEMSMGQYLENLDQLPFPDTGLIGHTEPSQAASPSATGFLASPEPGPSHTQREANNAESSGVLAMLCEQITILADTQTRERERLQKETKEAMNEVRATLAHMTGRLVACETASSAPTSSTPAKDPRTPARSPVNRVEPRPSTSREAGSSTGTMRRVNDSSRRAILGEASEQASQPSSSSLSPADLARSSNQVKTLRRHRPTATDAASVLRELALLEAQNNNKKGGHASNKCVVSQIEADWPDLYVYRIGGADPTYDTLSMAEFVAGYLSIMEEVAPINAQNAPFLRHLTYLRQLMEDSFLADWDIVRTAHKQVLNSIEHRRLAWADMPMVMETKRTALARIQQAAAARRQASASGVGGSLPDPCQDYQSLSCNLSAEHDHDGIKVSHICAFCWRVNGNRHTHPETNCRKAKEAAKAKKSKRKPGKKQE